MWKDIRFGLRLLLKNPGLTAVAVSSLALGIGANTAIFSFVNAVLLERLAVPDPSQLVTFSQTDRGRTTGTVWKLPTLDDFAKRNRVFSGVFGSFTRLVRLSVGDRAEWVLGELVTGEYFETLQVKPTVGRLFTDAEAREAIANPVCIISYGLWQREFAGDYAVVDRKILLNGHSYRILGVTAKGFHGTDLQHRFDLQIPATRIGDFMPAFGGATSVDWLKTLSWLTPMARLKPGVSRAEAQQATQRLLREIQMENDPSHTPVKEISMRLEDGSQGLGAMRSTFGRPLLVLMSVAGLVLVVACANLANLLLAKAQTRGKEFAVRMSIGASQVRLLRQLLLESLLLAAFGGLGGILLSFWISKTLLAFLNVGKSTASAVHAPPDERVLLFSVVLSFATAILFGVVPAWFATRTELLPGLKGEPAGSGRTDRLLSRRILAVTQIALSLVVVFAGSLLTRTLRGLETVDLGFNPDRVLALNVDPAANGYSNRDASRVLDEILRRTRSLPAVSAASLAASTPGGSMAISMNVEVPGYTPTRPGDDIADFNFVSPSYFQTVGQPLLRGRDFTERDDKDSARVGIVNEKFARHFFGGQNPIGRRFRQGGSDVQIAGVVADARDRDTRKGPEEAVYIPEKQGQTSGLTVLVRTGNNTDQLIPSLLAIVRSVDKNLPIVSVHTLDLQIEAGFSSERMLGYLSSLFGALTTLLAGIGLYGVVSYSVANRTREIGIRFAVGAQSRSIIFLFVREFLIMLVVGVIVGVPIALASGNALKSLLFGIRATDPLTLFGSMFALALTACLAVAVPLWRVAMMSPLIALRHE